MRIYGKLDLEKVFVYNALQTSPRENREFFDRHGFRASVYDVRWRVDLPRAKVDPRLLGVGGGDPNPYISIIFNTLHFCI